MDCPICGGGTSVADSRRKKGLVYRRRRCCVCGNRFSTYEVDAGWYKNMTKTALGDARIKIDEALEIINKGLLSALAVKERIHDDVVTNEGE